MENKKKLLQACVLSQNGVEDGFAMLDDLLIKHASRTDDLDLKEVSDFLTASEHETVWSAVLAFTNSLVQNLHLDEEEGIDEEDEIVEGSEECVQSLRRVSGLVSIYLETQYRPASLFVTLQQLHDTLIPLNDNIPGATAFKSSVARSCESWWAKNEPGGENLCTQLIPFLLLSALGPSTIDADVKRCWSIRGALLLLDFEDPSIESIRGLLLRCVIHPTFLKVPEGRRFLSSLFSLSECK